MTVSPEKFPSPAVIARTDDQPYASLLRFGGVAALVVAVLTVIEVVAFSLYPQPSTIAGWFDLFLGSPIIALVDFWGLEIPMYAMLAIVFLALYVVLRADNQAGMSIALTLALLGVAIFFATNNPFSMLSLSRRYAAATTDAEKSVLLAAGEAVLANTNQRAIGGFNIGLFLVSAAGLTTSFVMLKADTFSRRIATIGILAYGLSLGDYVRQGLTASVVVALLVILPGALLLVVWFSLVGRRLLQLDRH
jgi:hypothetical protein